MKLAGVSIKADDEENVNLMKQVIQPGQKIQVGIDADPMNRVRDDMMDTMRVVVYAPKHETFNKNNELHSGQNVNHYLSKQSEEDGGSINVRDDGTAVSTAALHSEGQITVGKTVEWMVHDLIPNVPFINVLADKFYPVKTPVKEYEGQLYGKDFRAWTRPVRDWIIPMLDTGTNKTPILAAVRGAGIASMFSGNPKNQALFAQVGAAAYGTIAGIRSISEFTGNLTGSRERKIPKRREEQREFDEYFDKLEYIKYRGLYEKAVEMAKKEEGVDVEAYLRLMEIEGESNDKYTNFLKNRKKSISIAGKSSNSETVKDYSRQQLKEVNEQLKDIDGRRANQPVGSYTALALRYKEEYESTLYGAKDTYDYMKIHRALPKHDKEFFTEFQKATPKERQEILKLVPKNQRNIYRQQWGLKTKKSDDVSLEEYFDKYKLPDANWEGWRPETSMENIKIKVMQNEGMELTERNYWDEHVDRADMGSEKPIAIEKLPMVPMSKAINQARLKKTLEGAGLKNVRIGLKTSAADVSYFNTNLNIVNQREEEINEGIRTYLNS